MGILESCDLALASASLSSSEDNGEYSFFDEASIYVRAGSGGQGASTYKKAKKSQNGIPDGGSGGLGGNVVLQVDPSLNTLARFSRRTGVNDNTRITGSKSHRPKRLQSFRAETGKPGGRMYDNGKGGEDCIVKVPPGTHVSIEHERIGVFEEPMEDEDSASRAETAGDAADIADDSNDHTFAAAKDNTFVEIGTLTQENPTIIVAKGGAGGEGTATLKGKKKGATRRGPQGGERFRLRLTLKIVADVALVGIPNAGKSTFLGAVTRAEPKIANYPFTTVVPNLGVWTPPDAGSSTRDVVLCDVPGLIAGAADGVGLGHAFLRHVERCHAILHLVDGTSDDPIGNYKMINRELERYGNGNLASMPQVVVVNKIDSWEAEGTDEFDLRKRKLEQDLKQAMGHTRILWVSAKERTNLDELMHRMAAYVMNIKGEN